MTDTQADRVRRAAIESATDDALYEYRELRRLVDYGASLGHLKNQANRCREADHKLSGAILGRL